MKIKTIESSANPLYKKLLSLTKSKGVRDENLCLVSGEKVINDLLKKPAPSSAFWIHWKSDHPLLQLSPHLQLIFLAKDLFRELDVVGSDAPLLCLPTPSVGPWQEDIPPEEIELLCALGDPNNLGALLRSACAFGIKKIVLLEESCHPFHIKAIKASSGACFPLEYFKGPSIKSLKGSNETLALDMHGTDLISFSFPKQKSWRLLLGEEGLGIPQTIHAQKIKIPSSGKVESLNATVAASILFYELFKAR